MIFDLSNSPHLAAIISSLHAAAPSPCEVGCGEGGGTPKGGFSLDHGKQNLGSTSPLAKYSHFFPSLGSNRSRQLSHFSVTASLCNRKFREEGRGVKGRQFMSGHAQQNLSSISPLQKDSHLCPSADPSPCEVRCGERWGGGVK